MGRSHLVWGIEWPESQSRIGIAGPEGCTVGVHYHLTFNLFTISSKTYHQSFTADDEHCICVRNIQLNNFISVHCQLKGLIHILNFFTFITE